MPAVKVAECETAADVMRLARESTARRRAWNATSKSIMIVPAANLEAPPKKLLLPPIQPRTLEEIVEELSDWEMRRREPSPEPPHVTVAAIKKREVARQYGKTIAELESDRRSQDIVRPRQMVMLLCKILTSVSFTKIGDMLGGRDHTTVLHANAKWDWLKQKLLTELSPHDPIEVWVDRAHYYQDMRKITE